MYFFKKLVIFFLFLSTLYAEDSPEIPVDTLKPTVDQLNLLIHGCVNVMTGHFVDNETDLTLPGPRPMELARSYSSGNEQHMTLATGWNFDGFTWCHLLREGEASLFHSFAHKNQIIYFTQGGGAIQTSRHEIKEGRSDFELHHHEDSYLGWCHTDLYGGGKSHRKNLNYNVREDFYTNPETIEISDGSGKKFNFWSDKPFSYKKKDVKRVHERLVLPIKRISYANGHYDTFGHQDRLIANKTTPLFSDINFYGADGDFYGSYAFQRTPNEVKVTASNERKVVYQFTCRKHCALLKSVEAFAPAAKKPYYSCSYEYTLDDDIPKIAKKTEPEGRFLNVEYSDDKVKSLNGPDALLFRFVYDAELKDHKRHLEGKTTVYDANGNKTVYSYEKSRLTQILQTLDGKPYIATDFSWTEDGSGTPGLLLKKSNSALTETYTYDSKGNLLKETLEGNLTGEGISNDSKTYTYLDRGNLLHTVRTARHLTTLSYYPDSDLTKAVYQKGDKFQKRQFYFYDENHVLIKKIQDDGTGVDDNDLEGVTYRKVTKITPEKGLPVITIDKFWNPTTQKEEPALKTELAYNLDGKVINKKIYTFETEWILAQEWQYEYDPAGRCIREIDPEEHVKTFSYDPIGNMLTEETDEHQQTHTYDLNNRRIRTEHTGKHIPKLTESWTYDPVGNKESHTDYMGHTTHYAYDGQNRLVEQKDPLEASHQFTYDILSHKISETDGRGNTTSYAHTIRGGITSTTFPDGSIEKRTYTRDGLVEEEIHPDGLILRYTHDAFGRLTLKKWFYEGALLKKEKNVYSAFFLLETTKDERTTTFTYNHKGQLIEEKEGEKVTTYSYDSLGNKIATRVYASSSSYIEELKQYDRLGRVIYSCETDETGSIYKEKAQTYNTQGKITRTTEGESVTKYVYDAFDNLITTVDPNGHKTRIIHDFQGKTTTVYPNGTQLIQIKDPLDRLISQEFLDTFGKHLQKQFYANDENGNKIREEFIVLADGEYQREVINTFKYDSQNRLITQIEGKDTPEKKVTRFTYDCMGRKTSHIKPNLTLHFAYDPLGQLINKTGPKLKYAYEYDSAGRLIRLINERTGKQTKRSYDEQDNVIEETLESGLTIRRTFDDLGRPISLTLPDDSRIVYSYEGSMLQKVTRQGKKSYTHQYFYDAQGRLIAETLPLQGQEVSYTYEKASHWTGTHHPHLTQEALGYDSLYNLLGISEKDNLKDEETHFHYDQLNQLIEENGHTYQHDSLYNRVQKDENAYHLNALNQLTAQSDTRYTYDSNGNLIRIATPEKTQLLAYDALDRLVSVEEGEQRTTYEYDGFNRRIAKRTENGVHNYLYDGKREIGSYKDDVLDALRILGTGIGSSEIRATVAIETRDKIYLPLHNPFGHLALLLDADTGAPVQHFHTTAFGECKLYNADGEERPLAASLSPWIVSSKRYDAETGFTLYGLRYYCPEIGRWITPDPAGFVDGPNLYAYVRNNPLIYTDLYGLSIFGGICAGVQQAMPFLMIRGAIAAATMICPPAGAVLGVACTCYNVYSTCSLAYNAGTYVVQNVATDGVIGGIGKIGTDAMELASHCTGDQVVQQLTAFAFNKGAGKIGSKTPPMSQTAQKVDSVAGKMFNNIAGKGAISQNGVPTTIPQGKMPSLDALSKAGQVMDRGGLTRAGRALNKHGNRVGSVFPRIFGNIESKNLQGQFQLDDILTHPYTNHFQNSKNGFEFFHPDGRGAYFRADGSFRGFIEENL